MGDANEWLRWSQHELHAAAVCADAGEHHIACHLAAGGAELALRGVVERFRGPEHSDRTQSLIQLRRRVVAAGCSLKLPDEGLTILARHATDALYPRGGGDAPEDLYGEHDAQHALTIARTVYDACRLAVSEKM